ncbi:uncharacterized protein [Phyllobates terribilis]|uniref:uncharacterized protein n=1 Tax=Phyllobates terribilis TaxID=111132 RepID=UPI003CCB0486
MTMEALVSPQNGGFFYRVSESASIESPESQHNGSVLDVVSECDSIDVVSESPARRKKKVKIVEPWEFLELPAADANKRARHPYKGILKHLSPDDSAVPESTEQCTETRIQSALPTMASPEEWPPLSPEIPICNQVKLEVPELQTFPMAEPGDPYAGAIVPYVGLAGNGAPYFIPGSGFFLPGNVDPLTLFSGQYLPMDTLTHRQTS